jgi:hypothetical protein
VLRLRCLVAWLGHNWWTGPVSMHVCQTSYVPWSVAVSHSVHPKCNLFSTNTCTLQSMPAALLLPLWRAVCTPVGICLQHAGGIVNTRSVHTTIYLKLSPLVCCAGKVTEKVGQMFKEDGSVGHQFTPDGAAGAWV